MGITNENKFVITLTKVLKDLKDNSDTVEYAKYFEYTYGHRTKEWAYCYKIHVIGINTNMYLEALYKILKHHYLEGKGCR